MSWFPGPDERAAEQGRGWRELVAGEDADRLLQAALDWVSERWGDARACPYCGHARWAVGAPVELQRVSGGAGARVVPVTCAHCGHTALIDATVMGLVPEAAE